ncbi:uncharacterized protein [Procambarus clarkii]|uniref:uncharacterized protein isoform X1 n=1 Tax=Procambarus clarkii TaxID=6728 RepID=UPI003742682F
MKMRGVSEAVVVSVGVFTLMLGMALAGSCVSDEPDCGPSECCIEGRPRKCAPLGEVDDRCHVYTQVGQPAASPHHTVTCITRRRFEVCTRRRVLVARGWSVPDPPAPARFLGSTPQIPTTRCSLQDHSPDPYY